MKMWVVSYSVLLLLVAVPAEPALITFFGEDMNPVPNATLTSRPNADAARDDFFTALNDLGALAGTEEVSGSALLNFGAAGLGSVEDIFPSRGPAGNGLYPISESFYLRLTRPTSRISTSQPIMAFGFYGVDIGDADGQLEIGLADSNFGPPDVSFDVPHSVGGGSGSVFFWGFISDDPGETFRVVRLNNTGSASDQFGFDDLTAAVFAPATSVPEPTALPLLGLFSTLLVLSRARGLGRDARR